MDARESPADRADRAGEALLALIAELLAQSRPAGAAIPRVTLDSPLDRDLGIDSLARVELLLRVEQAFDVQLPEHLLQSAETPRQLLRAVLAGGRRVALPRAARPIATTEDAEGVPLEAGTLVEALDWHCARHPDRVHVVVLGNDGETPVSITYGALRKEALAIAAGLAECGVGPGDTVAIMLPTSRDFFRTFTGILLAGGVPVPIYPPASLTDIAEHLRRQAKILDNCRAKVLVTVSEGVRAARLLRSLVPTLARVATADELARADAIAPPPRAPGDIALIQYTSGSTGDPKGVVLTHANLLANIRAMGAAARATSGDVFVSWLPLYHDMGLIGAWMAPLYYAFPLVVMPPTAFVNRPSRWLAAMHRYGGTISAAPNFAYEIVSSRVDERDLEGLDLSRWRLAFNGAEPVSPASLERFAARLARCGFRREALTPVYGLAECAVGLAFPPVGRGPRVDLIDRAALNGRGEARFAREGDPEALALASCGAPLPGYEIRVVGADGREVAERIEGHIEFRGPSATSGYYRNPEATRALLRGDWLASGDVGYEAGGEIFVTSREKDIIIRGGQHVHPHEIEEAVGAVRGVRKGCVAVFGTPDTAAGTERVVVLAETRLEGDEREALRARVVEAVRAVLGAPADEVVLAPPHTVLKTSSGKIRRAASRERYQRGITRIGRPGAWKNFTALALPLARARFTRLGRAAAMFAYGASMLLVTAALALVALAASFLPKGALRWRSLHGLARALLRASRLPLAVHGLENLPPEGAVVIAANHASYIDGPLIFALLPRPARFVAKRELAANPLASRLLAAAGVSYVDRDDALRGSEDARALVEIAREGEVLVFFPEGTFTRAPGLRPFRMGAFAAAAQASIPVLPLALRGTRSVLREGQWMPRRGPLLVRFGPSCRAEGSDWAAQAKLRERVRAEVLAGCGEPDLTA